MSTPPLAKFIVRQFNRWYFELLVLIAITILVVGFLWFVQPGLRVVRVQGQSGLEASQRYVQQLETYLDDVSGVKDALVEFNEAQRQRLASIVPREQDFAGIFVQVQALAQRHGFVLPAVTISSSDPVAPPPEDPSAERSEPTLNLGIMTINFSVQGQDYNRFKRFVVDVQQNLRLFDITVINFGSATKGPYTITMQTYYRP